MKGLSLQSLQIGVIHGAGCLHLYKQYFNTIKSHPAGIFYAIFNTCFFFITFKMPVGIGRCSNKICNFSVCWFFSFTRELIPALGTAAADPAATSCFKKVLRLVFIVSEIHQRLLFIYTLLIL